MTKPLRYSLLAPCLILAACQKPAPSQDPPLGASLEGAAIGGNFSLIDKDSRRVTWDQFNGKYRIVYFGFTSCPDACPTDVARMMKGLIQFSRNHPALAQEIQPIFISIDPARDTPQKVGQFTAAFSPRLLGLTGTEGEVAGAAKAFKVFYAKGQVSNGFYLMDHSRFAYLMGRDGRPIEALPLDQGPDAVASDLAKLVR